MRSGGSIFPNFGWDAPAADLKVESQLTPFTSQTQFGL